MTRADWLCALSLAAAAQLTACSSDTPAVTEFDSGAASDLGQDSGAKTDAGPLDSGTTADLGAPLDVAADGNVNDVNIATDGNVGDVNIATDGDVGDVNIATDGGGCTGPGRALCTTPTGESCVDTARDAEHCGRCGAACAPGQVCDGSVCACPRGTELCDGRCVASQVDPQHCGACANRCAAGQSCAMGQCVCPDDGIVCSGACVDPRSSNTHCGVCNTACGGGATCVAGQCTCGTGQSLCGAGSEARCVTLASDDAHCGACGNVCRGGQSCVMGACACPTGQTLCNGQCVTPDSDRNHCGACGNACPSNQLCSRGACTLSCDGGRTSCGAGSAMSCVNLQSDAAHCGACGAACGAGQTCAGGQCRCETGETACGSGSAAFCIDPQSDLRNCGACNNRCVNQANASGAVCAAGACQPTCATGFGNCDAMYANGCEVNLGGAVEHCGACGAACPSESGVNRVCVAGRCNPVSCAAIKAAQPNAPSGLYRIDPDGPGGNAALLAYCDMVTAGGGWTLVGRSRPGGNLLGTCVSTDGGADFGWRNAQGSVTNDSTPYSMNVAAAGLRFTEVLFGNYDMGKTWGARLYRHTVPADFLDGYRTRNLRIGAPEELSPSRCVFQPPASMDNPDGGTGSMFVYMGFTDTNGAFYFRDVEGPGFGLSATGWMTCYRNDNCYAGAINRQQGMLMVR